VPTISQNLTVPAGLANGQTADASQVLTLYNAMNAFVIPGTIGVLQEALSDDTLYTQVVASSPTKDFTISTVGKTKTILFTMSFSWAGASAQPSILYRINAATMATAKNTTNGASGSGVIFLVIGAHDTTDVARPLWGIQADSGGTITTVTASADLPNADTTSIGVTVAGTDATFKLKYVRAWYQG
jgi:hypothetical protein